MASLLSGATVFGATYTVTSTADTNTAGTLRWAVEQANTNAGADTINFANNLGTITLTDALPIISDAVTINGGTGNTVSGNNQHRVFFLDASSVAINNLTIADGYAKGGNGSISGGGGLGAGGAIFVNTGAVSLSRVNFANNVARGGNGGNGTTLQYLNESYAGGGGGGGLGGNGGAPAGQGVYGVGGDDGLTGAGGGAAGGGNGGDFGGGGGGNPKGGNGGFGGGGGGAGLHGTYPAQGGDGGFGGGGGGAASLGNAGSGGAFGGNGATPISLFTSWTAPAGGGGGGAGLGGAVFVRSENGASLSIAGSSESGSSVIAGIAGSTLPALGWSFTPAQNGQALGSAYFLPSGMTTFHSGTVNGSIAGVSGAGIVKSGTDTLALFGSNRYDGGTQLAGGVLALGSTGALGTSGTISFTGGTLQFSAANTTDYSSRFANTSGQIYGIDTNGQNVTFASRVASQNGSLTKVGTGTLTFSGTADNSALAVVVNQGAVVLAKTSSASVHTIGGGAPAANLIVNNGGLAQLGGTGGDQIYEGAVVQVNSGGRLDLNGRNEGFASLLGSGTVSNSAAGTTGILTLGETNASSAINAALTDGAGVLSLAKAGSGTLILAATSSYSGTTSILGGTLRLSGAGRLFDTGAVTVASGANFDLNGINQTIGLLTGSGTATLGSGMLTVGNGNFSSTFDGNIAGSGGLIKAGSGTFTLSGNTSYTGTTVINGGTVSLGGTSASSAYAIASGATLELAPSVNYTTSTVFSGSGVLRKTGTAAARWTDAAATFALGSGSLIDVQGGTFVGGANGNEIWTSNKSDLNVASGAIFNGVEANVRVDALSGSGIIRSGYNGAGYQGLSFGVDNGSGTFAGELADNPGAGVGAHYIKAGSGTQTLTGNNTYTGTTTLQGGTLALGSAGALGTTGVISFTGGTLQFSSSNTTDYSSRFANTSGQIYGIDTNGQNVTFASRVASPSGNLTKTGAGALTLSGTTDNSALAVIVNGGSVVLAKDSSTNVHAIGGGAPVANLIVNSGGTARLGGTGGDQIYFGSTVQVNSGGVFDLNGRSEGFARLAGSGTVRNSAAGTRGTLTLGEDNASSTLTATLVNGSGTVALAKVGSGTLTLAGNNSYSGGTTIKAGALHLAGSQAAGTGSITVDGGIFYISEGISLGGNTITLAGGEFDRALTSGANLTNAVNATSKLAGGHADATAKILQGTLTTSSILQTSFTDTSSALNDDIRLSDVYHLEGTGSSIFVLELSMTNVEAGSYLGWLDTSTNTWVNAVEGNTGTNHIQFINGAYDGNLVLGHYGVDVVNGTVWAVIDHNSAFTIVPEPTATALLVLGGVVLVARRRRKF